MAAAVLAITTAGASATGSAQADVCSDVVTQSASVNSVLTLRTAYRSQVSITEQTTITVPDAWPGTKLLVGGSTDRWDALDCFLPVDQYVYRNAPPTITTADSKVVINDSATVTANPADIFYQDRPTWNVGLWTVSKDANSLAVNFGNFTDPMPVKWTLTVRTDGLPISQPQPLPATEDGHGDLTWTASTGKYGTVFETATVGLPDRLAWEWDDWTWPAGLATDLLNVLGYGLAFYLFVWYLSRRFGRRPDASPQLRETARAAQFLAILGSVLYLAGYLNDILIGLANEEGISKHFTGTLQAYAAALAGATCYFSARRKGQYSWAFRGLFAVAIGAVPALLTRHPVTLLIGMAPLALAMFPFYAGIALWACRLWNCIRLRDGKDLVGPLATRLSGAQLRVSYAAAFILTAVDIGDPLITSTRDWSHWYLANPAVSRLNWVTTSVAYNGESDWLDGDLQMALWLLVAFAFIAVIRMAARDQRDIFLPWTGSLEIWSLVILVGFVFEGVWGNIAAVPAPAGLLFLILGFRYVALSRKGTPTIAHGMDITTPGASRDRLLTRHKPAFFAAAERIADLNSQLTSSASAAQSTAAERDTHAQLRAELAELHVRVPITAERPRGLRGLLRRRRQQYLMLPQPADPARVLLDSGPWLDWWDNGAQAVRSGLPLIVGATIYVVYREVRDGDIQLSSFPFGLSDAFSQVIGSAFGWALVAFTFGALLPYIRGIRGPVKGVTVGVVHAVALGLADWIFYRAGGFTSPDYVVESLVFLFFLSTLGVLVDVKTIQRYGGSTGLFSRIYRLGDTRAVITYLAAIIVTALGIWQQASTLSQATQQRVQTGQQVVQNISSVYGGSSAP